MEWISELTEDKVTWGFTLLIVGTYFIYQRLRAVHESANETNRLLVLLIEEVRVSYERR